MRDALDAWLRTHEAEATTRPSCSSPGSTSAPSPAVSCTVEAERRRCGCTPRSSAKPTARPNGLPTRGPRTCRPCRAGTSGDSRRGGHRPPRPADCRGSSTSPMGRRTRTTCPSPVPRSFAGPPSVTWERSPCRTTDNVRGRRRCPDDLASRTRSSSSRAFGYRLVSSTARPTGLRRSVRTRRRRCSPDAPVPLRRSSWPIVGTVAW
jgi:hypothetical protein